MKRKIIQLVSIEPGSTLALCNDGTVWAALKEMPGWTQLECIPQPDKVDSQIKREVVSLYDLNEGDRVEMEIKDLFGTVKRLTLSSLTVMWDNGVETQFKSPEIYSILLITGE